jgi:hypothetical protein
LAAPSRARSASLFESRTGRFDRDVAARSVLPLMASGDATAAVRCEGSGGGLVRL